ncbi:MAG: DUF86 domain-containing protein [Calditrichaeota bacterium]|nr:DUF86 domain-containing protein [Calditrichota bacterium]
MYDEELILVRLKQIHNASKTILERFEPVNMVSDFTDSPSGMEKLDSICMLLIVIGESLKNLDKISNSTLLQKYDQIDWKRAKGLRDIISHQYFDINAEAIFDVCETKIKPLVDTIAKIIEDINNQ